MDKKSPNTVRKSPNTVQKSPNTVQKSPNLEPYYVNNNFLQNEFDVTQCMLTK
jgi:hypothetical protein